MHEIIPFQMSTIKGLSQNVVGPLEAYCKVRSNLQAAPFTKHCFALLRKTSLLRPSAPPPLRLNRVKSLSLLKEGMSAVLVNTRNLSIHSSTHSDYYFEYRLNVASGVGPHTAQKYRNHPGVGPHMSNKIYLVQQISFNLINFNNH
jgi:hypothetical protein